MQPGLRYGDNAFGLSKLSVLQTCETQSASSHESQYQRSRASSPLKVRKTRENLSNASGKSTASAPIIARLQVGGVLKFREPGPTPHPHPNQESLPNHSRSPTTSPHNKENRASKPDHITSYDSFGYPSASQECEKEAITTSSEQNTATSRNITPALYMQDTVKSRKPSTIKSHSSAEVSKTDSASSARRPSQPIRSVSDTQKSDGLRSRVLTQVKSKLRKSSKKADHSVNTTLPPSLALPITTLSVLNASRSQSRTSDWVSTDAVLSDCRSLVASSDYSCIPEESESRRRLSLDSAILQLGPYRSNGTLFTSTAASRLSSVFTPTGTRTTARTSLFDSPSRRLVPAVEQSNASNDIPAYTFHAALSVTFDSDNLYFASNKTDVWAAIEIRGEVVNSKGLLLQSIEPGAPSLAVAIVIDNSYHASPIYLQRACSAALDIATQLRGRGDHLALYTTIPSNDYTQLRDYESLSLTTPDLTAIRRELNNLLCNDTLTNGLSQVAGAITQATDALRRLDFARENDVRLAQRIVILMTPHSVNIEEHIPSILLDKIQLHHLTPGVISRSTQPNNISGWCINSTRPQQLDLHDAESEDDFQYRLINSLLSSARYNVQIGSISNVVIDVIPGPETSITAVIGKQCNESLLPGQTITVLVKMNVKSLEEVGQVNEGKYQASGNGFTISRAFDELEKVLNEISRDLLTVRVSYNHSHFPSNTSLEAKEICWLRRPAHPSRGSTSSSLSRMSIRSKIATHNSVAMSTASHPDARVALTQLMLQSRSLKYADPTFLTLLREELCFQKDIDAQQHLDVRVKKEQRLSHRPSHLDIVCARLRPDSALSMASSNNGSNNENQRRPHVTKSGFNIMDLQSPLAETMPEVIDSCNFEAMNEEDEDPARLVWRQMRQVSKGRGNMTIEPTNKDQYLSGSRFDGKMLALKHEALRNRRSIGNDTLKSMARSVLPRDESYEDVRFQ